jgi:acetyl-CoA carboxylase/biotin carboxylase 1
MKCVDNCQSLEIQIIADQNGHIISLFNHNYSIQQRHEKSIEETSRILPPPKILEQMKKGAVRLAKLIGYVGLVLFFFNVYFKINII